MRGRCILYVEDDDNDIRLFHLVCAQVPLAAAIHTVRDGEEAIAYLEGEGPYANRARHPMPALVVTDLKMPKLDGFDLVEHIRHHPTLKSLVVIMLSSSALPPDVKHAYALGVNAFVTKPHQLPDLRKVVSFLNAWLQCNQFVPLEEIETSSGLSHAAARR
jgi:CheY-like chemotaxis protein